VYIKATFTQQGSEWILCSCACHESIWQNGDCASHS